tara:strand:- start:300 stop:1211 length:912 start_codon:yes stop_codon:yes gene_type:complete
METASFKRASFIVNPLSGKLTQSEKVKILKRHFNAQNSEIIICNSPIETANKTRQEVKKGSLIVACGGDGTINLIASEVIRSKGIMAVCPMGRGNDFAKNIGITSFEEAANAFFEKKCVEVKYLTLNFENSRKGIGLTCAGVGMLSTAAFRATQIPILKGKLLYLTAAIISLFKLRAYIYKLKMDEKSLKLNSIIIVVAAGAYTGGGLPIAPEANAHKNKLNLLVANSIGKLKALGLIRKVITGNHLTDPAVESRFGQSFKITTDSADKYGKYVYADGEYLGDTPVKISIGKEPLKVLASHFD